MPPGRDLGSGSGADSSPDPAYPSPCLDPETIGDAVARDRRTSGLAIRARPSGRTYSYRDFITTSYKAGNVLRYLGVRPGDEVRVAADRVPETVLTFYGAAQLGAVTRFGGGTDGDPPRVVVAPATREAEIDLPPGHHLAVYGDPPEDPDVTHWETEVWSENPAIHPVAVEGSDPVLAAGDRTYTHGEILAAAERVVSRIDLDTGTEVTVRGSLADPAVVASGLVAPILAGSTIVLADDGDDGATDSPPVEIDGVGVNLDLFDSEGHG
jgi:hypothetical protein